MKAISIKLEVPVWIDEEKFSTKIKRIAERMVYPEKLSAEEVKAIFGTFEEEIVPMDVRKKEKEMLTEMWIARFLR